MAAAAGNFFGKVCPILGENNNFSKRRSFRLNATTAAPEVYGVDGPSSSSSSTTLGASSVRWGQLALQGPRPEMEDDLELDSDLLPEFTLAAVYDGHAGLSSVTYLKRELSSECVKALQGGALLQSENLSTVEAALSQAFVQVDQRLLSWLEQPETPDKDSGSTATVMFLGKDKVVVAHVGDSRVVLSRRGKPEDLTADHRPFGSSKVALTEGKRILAAGGWISNGRVCGNLSVSRAFGDIFLKTRRKEMLEDGLRKKQWTSKFVSKLDLSGEWLTAAPDVKAAVLGEDAEFIILASDGLWDSMKSNEAVTFVREQLKEHGDIQRACEALAAAALARNGQDNITILIADFGRVARQEGFNEQKDFAAGLQQVVITAGILLLSIFATQLFR